MRHTIKKGRKLFKSKRHGKTRRVQRGGAPIDVIRHKIKVGEYDDETGLGSANYSSGTYVGHFENGKKQGEGKMTYVNGDVYDGNWVNGKKQGEGKMTYVNRDVYDGDWVNDKQQGEGLYSYSDGEGGFNESYKGEWKNGEMTGHGTYKFKSGNSYEGEWVNGEKQDGKGTMTYPDGSMYEGEWLNDAKNGKGKMTYEDGNVYEGDWVNGKPHGQGRYEFSDGNGEFDESYKGEWKNGKMHGHGIYRSQSGNVYEGTWANDNKNGQGKMTYANGDVYEGEWDANYIHGQGRMTYHNGDVYEGPWRYGQRHGENGRMRYADDGRVYEGEWWKDKMHGDGTMTAANGDVIYEGLWKNDAQIPVFFDPATGKLADNDGYNPPAPIMRFHNSDNMLYTNDKIKGKYQFSDVIYNEEKNVVDELREDPTTIALLLNRTYYVPSIGRLRQLMNDRRLIRYECTKKDTADGFSIDTDVNKTVPYFGLNGIVSNQGGVVPLFDLWAAINSGHRAFELVKTRRKLLTVASHHVAYDYGSWVGSAHCQGDKDADIYELQILRSSEKPRSRNKTRRNSQEDSGTNKRFRAHSYSLHPYNPGR